MEQSITKQPPYSIDAEQAVLGGLMMDADAWYRVEGRVYESDFYRREHRLMFAAIAKLAQKGEPRDAVTISEQLVGHEQDTGGLAHIADMVERTPSAANVAAYADIVREKAKRRQMIERMQRATEAAYAGEDITETISSTQEDLEQLSAGSAAYLGIGDVLTQTGERIRINRRAAKDGIIGLRSAVPSLDRKLGGFHGGRLYLVVGRPSLGKTAFAYQVTLEAGRHGMPTGRCDLEMSYDELGARAMANQYNLNFSGILRGNDHIMSLLNERKQERNINTYPIYFDADSDSLGQITARINEWHRKHGIQAAVVDYIQLIRIEDNRKTRQQQLGDVSRSLKRTAKRLGIPIIAVAQIAREVEKEGRRPRMSDLRESGDMEQDADVILALNGDVTNGEKGDEGREVEIGILKNRQGRVGWLDDTDIRFDGRTQRFYEMVGERVA